MDVDDAGELAARGLGDEEAVARGVEAEQALAHLRLGRRVAELRAEACHGPSVVAAPGRMCRLRIVHGGKHIAGRAGADRVASRRWSTPEDLGPCADRGCGHRPPRAGRGGREGAPAGGAGGPSASGPVPADAAGMAAFLTPHRRGGAGPAPRRVLGRGGARLSRALPARTGFHVAEAPGGAARGRAREGGAARPCLHRRRPRSSPVRRAAGARPRRRMGTYVDAAHRRRGVGAALAREQLAAALDLGYDEDLHRPARRQPRLTRVPPGAGLHRGRRRPRARRASRAATSTSCSSSAS